MGGINRSVFVSLCTQYSDRLTLTFINLKDSCTPVTPFPVTGDCAFEKTRCFHQMTVKHTRWSLVVWGLMSMAVWGTEANYKIRLSLLRLPYLTSNLRHFFQFTALVAWLYQYNECAVAFVKACTGVNNSLCRYYSRSYYD